MNLVTTAFRVRAKTYDVRGLTPSFSESTACDYPGRAGLAVSGNCSPYNLNGVIRRVIPAIPAPSSSVRRDFKYSLVTLVLFIGRILFLRL